MAGSRALDPFQLAVPAGATATVTGPDMFNMNARGVRVVLDMTAFGTGSVTLTIQAKDQASGKYQTLIAGAAVVSNATFVYVVYPGLTPVANLVVSDVLPYVWRIVCTANNANPTTYTVGGCTLD